MAGAVQVLFCCVLLFLAWLVILVRYDRVINCVVTRVRVVCVFLQTV
jgi:hypothetical protein